MKSVQSAHAIDDAKKGEMVLGSGSQQVPALPQIQRAPLESAAPSLEIQSFHHPPSQSAHVASGTG